MWTDRTRFGSYFLPSIAAHGVGWLVFSSAGSNDRPSPRDTPGAAPLIVQRGETGVTVMARNTVVVTSGSDFLTLTWGEAWDLGEALAEARRLSGGAA